MRQRAAISIIARHRDAKCHKQLPLAIYIQKGKPVLITFKQVKSHLQYLASQVYKITNITNFKRFTSHSLRIGACVQLHSAGTPLRTSNLYYDGVLMPLNPTYAMSWLWPFDRYTL